jgi:hypothetical protein
MGFADLAALMEFHANNPTAPNKPVAVMMVYNNTPAAVFALKKSGITKPADLAGKKLGAPVFDAGRKASPSSQGQRHRRRQLDQHGPAAARDHAGQGRRGRDHRLLLHQPAEPGARGVKAEDIVGAALPAARRQALRQRHHRRARSSSRRTPRRSRPSCAPSPRAPRT